MGSQQNVSRKRQCKWNKRKQWEVLNLVFDGRKIKKIDFWSKGLYTMALYIAGFE